MAGTIYRGHEIERRADGKHYFVANGIEHGPFDNEDTAMARIDAMLAARRTS